MKDIEKHIIPLEWEEPCSRNNYTYIAKSVFGDYYVHIDGGRHQGWLDSYIKPYEVLIGPEVGSIYEAKRYVEVDYVTRLSKLFK